MHFSEKSGQNGTTVVADETVEAEGFGAAEEAGKARTASCTSPLHPQPPPMRFNPPSSFGRPLAHGFARTGAARRPQADEGRKKGLGGYLLSRIAAVPSA